MKTLTIGDWTFETSNKDIEIKYNNEGLPYFMNGRRRHFLSDYMRTNYGCTNNELYAAGLHAYDSTSGYYPDFIQLDDKGESVKIWRSVKQI